jgi:hypothetical protein
LGFCAGDVASSPSKEHWLLIDKFPGQPLTLAPIEYQRMQLNSAQRFLLANETPAARFVQRAIIDVRILRDNVLQFWHGVLHCLSTVFLLTYFDII